MLVELAGAVEIASLMVSMPGKPLLGIGGLNLEGRGRGEGDERRRISAKGNRRASGSQ